MTKKDYERAAEIIGAKYPPALVGSTEITKERDKVVETFVALFSADNTRFNADRFRTAVIVATVRG